MPDDRAHISLSGTRGTRRCRGRERIDRPGTMDGPAASGGGCRRRTPGTSPTGRGRRRCSRRRRTLTALLAARPRASVPSASPLPGSPECVPAPGRQQQRYARRRDDGCLVCQRLSVLLWTWRVQPPTLVSRAIPPAAKRRQRPGEDHQTGCQTGQSFLPQLLTAWLGRTTIAGSEGAHMHKWVTARHERESAASERSARDRWCASKAGGQMLSSALQPSRERRVVT
jgi:hypothetical protein